MITPAISVLSAVEGLTVINPGFEPYVVPLTLVVLSTLFRCPVSRHRRRRLVLRPDHLRVVRGHRQSSASSISAMIRRSSRLQSRPMAGACF